MAGNENSLPLLKCKRRHHIRGRIRINCRALKYLEEFKEEIQRQLEMIKAVHSARISCITENVLIYFDEEELSEENLLELIENVVSNYSLPAYKNERIEKNSQVVIERKLGDESIGGILKNIAATAGALFYFSLRRRGPQKMTDRVFGFRSLVTLGLASPVLKSGAMSLVKNKRPNADTLSSSAILASVLLGRPRAALTIILLENMAELLTVYTMKKTRSAIKDMLSVGEDFVWKKVDGEKIQKVPVGELLEGDCIVVHTGEKISVDGKIMKGEALIDQSSITGEFMPVNKKVDGEVFAGTILKNGTITIEAEKVGDDTAVSRIIKLVEDAACNKAPIQSYADLFSAQLIPLNFLLAGLVYLSTRSFSRALSMLVIDYSCGIRLSTATALSAAISTAAKNGTLIKGSNFIESLSKIDTLILDKTGTLTEGNPKLTTVEVLKVGTSEKELLQLAAAAEETSNHPLALAVLNRAKGLGYDIPRHSECEVVVSRGVVTEVEGCTVRVGSRRFMEESGINTELFQDIVKGVILRGETVVYISKGEFLIGVLGISDPLRENMKKAINRLRYQGIDDIILLTGDLQQQAEIVSSRMAIDRYESELMPEDKARNILQLQSKGTKVAMVGDGINDAPALSYADVGIAIGSTRTDIAMEAADITITGDDPMMIPSVLGLSQSTMKVIKENFGITVGINTLALVLGAAGVFPVIYGAVIHNTSTIFVVGNSLRLLFYDMKR